MTRSTRSSLRLFAVGFLMLAPALRAQAFEGSLSVFAIGMPPDAGMSYFVKGDRLRLELSTPGQATLVMILDGPAKKQYVIFTDQKAYTTTSFAELMMTTDSVRKESERNLQGASMTPLGTRATVAGHKCDLYRYRDQKSVNDVCLSTEFGALGGVGGLWGHIGRSMEVGNPPPWAVKLVSSGAFALRLTDTTGTTLWEVRRIGAQTLAPELFTPPSGFSSMSDAPLGPPKPPTA